MKAYRIWLDDSPPCIVFATGKPRATFIAVQSFKEMGFCQPRKWPRCKVRRAKEFDSIRNCVERDRVYGEDYIEDLLETPTP